MDLGTSYLLYRVKIFIRPAETAAPLSHLQQTPQPTVLIWILPGVLYRVQYCCVCVVSMLCLTVSVRSDATTQQNGGQR